MKYIKKPYIVLFLALFVLFQNLKAQKNDIDKYFDDGNLANTKNIASIDLLKIVDMSLSLRILHDVTAIGGVAAGASYRFGNTIPNDLAFFNTLFSGFLFSQKAHFVYFTDLIPANNGYEIWGGLFLTKDIIRKKSILMINAGYMDYSADTNYYKGYFTNFNFLWKLYEENHFFLTFDLNNKFVFAKSNEESENSMVDIIIGIGISAGYKF
jgi:hypothetical protein